MPWIDEEWKNGRRVGLMSKGTIFDEKGPFQQVTVIDTDEVGRALLLDGMWMTSEQDEASYHEMLVHPALCTLESSKRVLIVGGGDGGTAREVLRYPDVEHVDLVEIDALVVEASKAHIPSVARGAWDDPRLHVHIGDGAKFVTEAEPGSYDAILVDGADPIGPAKVLFENAFFMACHRALREGGTITGQAGSPVLQMEEHLDMITALNNHFDVAAPYYGCVYLYPGALWSWGWAKKGQGDPRACLPSRVEAIEGGCKIYNREIHAGAFAAPNFVKKALAARGR